MLPLPETNFPPDGKTPPANAKPFQNINIPRRGTIPEPEDKIDFNLDDIGSPPCSTIPRRNANIIA
jgi:hypothetical protein